MPKKILIVEDNPDHRRILGTILRRVGYEVSEAIDGIEGIERALAESPDLIIMDLGLPGMDGIETTGKLKRIPMTARIPVIAYTIWGEEFRDRAREAGVLEYLVKTTATPEALKEVIGRILGPAARPLFS